MAEDTRDHAVYAMRFAAMEKENSELRARISNLIRDIEVSRAACDRAMSMQKAVEQERERLEAALIREFEKYIMDAMKGVTFDPTKNTERIVDTVATAIMKKVQLHSDMFPKTEVSVEHNFDVEHGAVDVEITVKTDDPFLRQRLHVVGFKAEDQKCEFVQRDCVVCGLQMDVLEAIDEETGKIVPVPEEVMCGPCTKKKAEGTMSSDRVRFKEFKIQIAGRSFGKRVNLMDQIMQQIHQAEAERFEGLIANMCAVIEMSMDIGDHQEALEEWLKAISKTENFRRDGRSFWIRGMGRGMYFELVNPRIPLPRVERGFDFGPCDNILQFTFGIDYDGYNMWVENPRSGALYSDSTWTWWKDSCEDDAG